MALAEQELSVEVANFNGVHVNLQYHKTLLHIFPSKIMQRFVELKELANNLHFIGLILHGSSSKRSPKERNVKGERETHTHIHTHTHTGTQRKKTLFYFVLSLNAILVAEKKQLHKWLFQKHMSPLPRFLINLLLKKTYKKK
jgi:hypothetical protein